MLNSSRADVVWVGLGAPKQERWMSEHQGSSCSRRYSLVLAPHLISTPEESRKLRAGCASTAWNGFSVCRGSPRRLWRRYLIYGTQFVALVLLESLGLKKFS